MTKYKQANNGQECPILGLDLLQKEGFKSYTNTVIAISGFMSKNSDKTKEW